MITGKLCSKCDEWKSLDRFGLHFVPRERWQSQCKDCNNEYSKQWYQKHKNVVQLRERRRARNRGPANRNRHLKRLYGITLEDFNNMLEQQSKRCAICKGDDPLDPRKNQWQVDHDHKSGKVRGILCFPCNLMLGYAKDRIETLQESVVYLGRSS